MIKLNVRHALFPFLSLSLFLSLCPILFTLQGRHVQGNRVDNQGLRPMQ